MLPDIHYDCAFGPPAHPLNTDTAFELREMLLADLRNGRWRPGERLPAERQMMEAFKVGRSTVRRALMQMKSMGLITQTVGSTGRNLDHDPTSSGVPDPWRCLPKQIDKIPLSDLA